ncbi:hypothetical protein NECAME_15597 [Necator americanus]|uniref:Uncharacterized protein n=1 Tax=Necator americanus TaxID=51031 RepID=W2SIZ8_NECAM|nr:hypothetical protein NECAME_15597 [Necator americanus]ETN68826.1 hypothetical protein NECAME_15597 [Necator americanus]
MEINATSASKATHQHSVISTTEDNGSEATELLTCNLNLAADPATTNRVLRKDRHHISVVILMNTEQQNTQMFNWFIYITIFSFVLFFALCNAETIDMAELERIFRLSVDSNPFT